MFAYHRGQLKAVEIGHADIDQHDRDVALQQDLQGFRRRAGLDQVLTELRQDRLIVQQFGWLVIDQQDVDLFLVDHGASPLTSGRSLTFGTRALVPSCPRKRAPRATNSGTWTSAFAGVTMTTMGGSHLSGSDDYR